MIEQSSVDQAMSVNRPFNCLMLISSHLTFMKFYCGVRRDEAKCLDFCVQFGVNLLQDTSAASE